MHRRSLCVEPLESRQLLTVTTVDTLPGRYIAADLGVYAQADSLDYFSLATAEFGTELWQSDGTPDGTRMVEDLNQGTANSNPQFLTTVGDKVFFVAYASVRADTDATRHLWVSEAGSSPVPISVGEEVDITAMVGVGNQVVFVDGRTQRIWTSDGKDGGTRVISEPIVDDANWNTRYELVELDGELYVSITGDARVWKWDEQAGFDHVQDLSDERFDDASIKRFGDELWVRVSGPDGSQLRKLDLETGELTLIKEWDGGHVSWSDASWHGRQLVFTLASERSGFHDYGLPDYEFANRQLWRTDGTTAGTTQVNTHSDGPIVSVVQSPDSIVYVQQARSGNFELWQQWEDDAAARKAHEFARIVPQTEVSLIRLGPAIYFVDGADWKEAQRTLYRFVPESGDVEVVRDFSHGIISALRVRDGAFLFIADEGIGLGVWASDGTTTGTRLLRGFETKIEPISIFETFSSGGKLLFSTLGDYSGFSPTLLRKTLWSRSPNGVIQAIAELSFGANLFTDQSDFRVGIQQELPYFRTDGTRAGTHFLNYGTPRNETVLDEPREPNAPGVLFPSHPVTVHDVTYSVRSTAELGAELWATRGLESWIVKDIMPGRFGSNPRDLTVIDDVIYFSARDRTTIYRIGGIEAEHEENWELWRSDGTAEGTYKLLEINPDVEAWPFSTSSSHPAGFSRIGRGFLFSAKFDGELDGGSLGTRRGWFSSDGTTAGTFRLEKLDGLTQLSRIGEDLLFVGTTGLWRTDGTRDGTVKIYSFRDTTRGAQGLKNSDGQAVFTVTDDGGVFIFATDGTNEGTKRLEFIPDVSHVSPFAPVNGVVYITAKNGDETKTEVWAVDDQQATRLKSFSHPVDVRIRKASARTQGMLVDSNLRYRPAEIDVLISVSHVDEVPPRQETFVSDGTMVGTHEIELFDHRARNVTLHNDRLYFTVDDEELGWELWETDGTQAGTKVYDIVAGSGSSHPDDLVVVEDVLYFTASKRDPSDPQSPPQQVLLQIGGSQTLRGDVNSDGSVNFADFLKLSSNFGKSDVSQSGGDVNGDLRVDFADFLILSANFGRRLVEGTDPIEHEQRNFDRVESLFALFAEEGG